MRARAIALLAAALVAVAAHAQGRPPVPGGVYDKPYLKSTSGGAVVGGYIDHELYWNDARKTFDQHRFIPFLFSEVSERVHVSAEIEFEHGGFVTGEDEETDGEIKLEYATVDIAFHESLTYRAGVILSPLGRFNLIHDSPLNDLTNRPLVAQQIVPTTLSEAGMGFFGALYPSPSALVGYELYVVNGFNQNAAASLRDGRGSLKSDNNDGKSVVGRVNYSPMLGLDLGGSFHRGAYDDAGDRALTVLAADAAWNRGPFDLRGEFATASVDGAADDRRSGYYGQIGYHFLHGAMPRFPNSSVTTSLRYDAIDLGSRDETRVTVGANFRPEPETAIKLDYEIYDQADANDGWILSVASYF